jgi:hypothetical protein
MMKKAFLLGGVALIMLALMGCGGDDAGKDIIDIITGGDEPDGPTTSGNWGKILNDFEVQPGTNPGEIQYKFSSITDDTAVVYTLYYIQGKINSALLIIATDQKEVVNPCDWTTRDGFTPGITYSMVVEAKKPGNTEGSSDVARSGVKQVKTGDPLPQLKLTLNDTGGTTILRAVLYEDLGQAPCAMAINSNKNFSFSVYDSSSFLNKPAWTKKGEYFIVLLTSTDVSSPLTSARYIYTNGGEEPAKFNFAEATATIADWSKFKYKAATP